MTLPPLLTTPLTADALPEGHLVRVVGTAPPDVLLKSLYGPAARVALAALARTDPVLHRELGGVHLVQPDDWPTGAGAGWILAPFVRAPSPETASRFSNGSYGVWYGADRLETAQAEVGYHLGAYLARTAAAPGELPRTVLTATPDPARPIVDLRPPASAPAGVLDSRSWAASQPFGAACRVAQHWGILWPSVRHAGGLCVGVLRPPALASAAVTARCVAYWDGQGVRWG